MSTASPQRHIVISGSIGVGKSTLMGAFLRANSPTHSWYPIYEEVESNPYLPLFYEDMRRWAFHMQLYFLSSMSATTARAQHESMFIIQERSIYEVREVFTALHVKSGRISKPELTIFDQLYEAVSVTLRPPDLIIYLDASPETSQHRIISRGRSFEQHINIEYLVELRSLYQKWLLTMSQIPIQVINTDSLSLQDLERIASDLVLRSSIRHE